MRPRRVEMGDALRRFGRRDVEEIEAGGLHVYGARLIRDGHHVPDDVERVGAHLRVREVGLDDHLRRARVGDVDRGEVLRRRLVREPQDTAPVARSLYRHAFSHPAEALQFVMGEQVHVPGECLVGACAWAERCGGFHRRVGERKGAILEWGAGRLQCPNATHWKPGASRIRVLPSARRRARFTIVRPPRRSKTTTGGRSMPVRKALCAVLAIAAVLCAAGAAAQSVRRAARDPEDPHQAA